jgi:hypothetical protein
MKTHQGARRRRLVIAAAAGAAVFAVLVAACGSSSSDEAAPETAPAGRQDQALAFAQCMRKNGVPDFPDPDPSGRFSGAGHEEDDPAVRAAQEACRDLAPGGEHENLGDPVLVEQMRAYSQCMRDNGLPDFPDPDADGRLRGVGHEQRDDPTYRAASETCREKLPGGGEH